MHLPHHLAIVPTLLIGVSCGLTAAHAPHEHHDGIPRVVVQALVGTADFEPGVALEWRFGGAPLMVRPEAFLNEDDRVGGGGSVGWRLPIFDLPQRHAITVGPRVVHHNSDEYGWGFDAMAIWHFDLVPSQRGHHFLEVIGTLGAIEEERPGDNDMEFGASVGVGYGYQF